MKVSDIMMFENEITSSYFAYKGILMLLFSHEFDEAREELADVLYFDYDNFLVILINIVNKFYNVFDKDIINNLDKIIEYFRYDYVKEHPEDKDKVFNIINEMISKRNVSSLSKLKEFVAFEWNCRFQSPRETFKVISTNNNIMRTYDKIKYLLEYDYCILCSHSQIVSEDDFLEMLPDFVDINSAYILGINKLIMDCPEILGDEIFRRRTKFVLNLIKENLVVSKPKDANISLKLLKKRHQSCYDQIKILEKYYIGATE